jgi:hypothetical protein
MERADRIEAFGEEIARFERNIESLRDLGRRLPAHTTVRLGDEFRAELEDAIEQMQRSIACARPAGQQPQRGPFVRI